MSPPPDGVNAQSRWPPLQSLYWCFVCNKNMFHTLCCLMHLLYQYISKCIVSLIFAQIMFVCWVFGRKINFIIIYRRMKDNICAPIISHLKFNTSRLKQIRQHNVLHAAFLNRILYTIEILIYMACDVAYRYICQTVTWGNWRWRMEIDVSVLLLYIEIESISPRQYKLLLLIIIICVNHFILAPQVTFTKYTGQLMNMS